MNRRMASTLFGSGHFQNYPVSSRLVLCCSVFLWAFFAGESQAQLWDPHVGISVKAGTTGAGLDLTKSIFENVNIRLGYNRLDFSHSLTASGITYDGDVKLETVPVFLDWHVFSGGFRISTGVFYNNTDMTVNSRATGLVTVGNTTLDASTLGTLRGSVGFGNSFVPYFGFGWGNSVDSEDRWGFAADVGVYYQGEPSVTLTQSGTAVSAADLAQEEQSLRNALNDLTFYPVATVGVFFRF